MWQSQMSTLPSQNNQDKPNKTSSTVKTATSNNNNCLLLNVSCEFSRAFTNNNCQKLMVYLKQQLDAKKTEEFVRLLGIPGHASTTDCEGLLHSIYAKKQTLEK
ncbi:hypothetical protein FRX31_026998 [Thalictrum thalictroides]|uniref:Uncharacterized protein n=1 Tax=Thalictrum thalictroides TaxID=46969 RepID=A0A7J6VGT7_THATH|nr:hypothetical protein FRX31_026998 [Thalictrum thalictroides]